MLPGDSLAGLARVCEVGGYPVGGTPLELIAWYMSVKLEFGEWFVPDKLKAIGEPAIFGDDCFSNRESCSPMDGRAGGSLVLSYSSTVYVSQSHLPFDF